MFRFFIIRASCRVYDKSLVFVNLAIISGSGMRRLGMNFSGSGQGEVAGACECSNELSDSVKCETFLD
jgi:hypothetical protein